MPAYKDEKTKTWYVQFRYRDWQNNSRSTTKRGFKNKREALNYEHDFKLNSQKRVDITVAALVQTYLEDRKMHVKESTYESIRQTMENYFLPFLGKMNINDLKPIVFRQWQNEITKKNLKPATLYKIHRHCSTLLNFAVKFYGLQQNFLRLTGSIGKSERSLNFWEFDEFVKFIEKIYNNKHRVIFNLLFFSGMRIGELLALNIGDFDFKNNTVNISKSKMLVNGMISTPKNVQSIRTIDIPPVLMQEVKEYIKSFKVIPNPIFQITPSALSQTLSKYAAEAKVKKIRLHDLRHSHASFLIHKGVNITAISKRLGHKSPKMTLEVYAHMYVEAGKQISSLLQEAAIVSHIFVNKNE